MRRSKMRPRRLVLICFALLTLSTLLLQSCKKEYFEMDRMKDPIWNPEFAVPLINSTVTVPEVLSRVDDQDVITVDPATGLLALKYSRTVFSFTADSWLVLSDQIINGAGIPITATDNTNIGTNGSVTVAPGSFAIPISFPNGEELMTIDLDDGNLSLQLTNNTGYSADVNITIPSLRNGATVFSTGQVTLGAGASQAVTQSLIGWTFDLTQGGLGYNEVRMQYTTTYTGPGSATPGIGVATDLSLTNLDFAFVDGRFQQPNINIDLDSVRLRIFENNIGGVILWDSAIVNGIFTNSIGMELGVNMDTLRARNAVTNQSLDIQGLTALTIPAMTPSAIVGQDSFNLVGNNNGANVNDVANLNPDYIIYKAGITGNPNNANAQNFCADTSSLQLDLDVILPFDGKAQDFAISTLVEVDIFPLDLDTSSGGATIELEYVILRLIIDNGFPADARAQVYFYDSTKTDSNNVPPIDSLFDNGTEPILVSPAPGPNHVVDQSQKVQKITDIVLSKEKLDYLEGKGFRKLEAVGWLETFNMGQTRAKIFNDYSMDLRLGLMVKSIVTYDVNQ